MCIYLWFKYLIQLSCHTVTHNTSGSIWPQTFFTTKWWLWVTTVACEKLEPLFLLVYSANMYSRKTTLHTRLWNYTLPKVSVFYAEYSASYSRKTRGLIFSPANCKCIHMLKINLSNKEESLLWMIRRIMGFEIAIITSWALVKNVLGSIGPWTVVWGLMHLDVVLH